MKTNKITIEMTDYEEAFLTQGEIETIVLNLEDLGFSDIVIKQTNNPPNEAGKEAK